MDQVKMILAAIKKHHFWVLGGIVLIVLLGVWWRSAVGLDTQFQSRKSELERQFSEMASVAGTTDPPNQGVIEAIRALHGKLTQEVLAAWEYLYEQQQKNNPIPDVLGKDFKIVWNSLGPDDPIPVEYRDRYWNFIKDYFPRQRERLEIRRPKDEEPGAAGTAGVGGHGEMMEGGPGRRRNEAVEYVGKVAWDNENYLQLLKRFQWTTRPNSQQVRLAQEDLWVYDTLLNIVKDLNQAARSHYNAPVKRIKAVDIGAAAQKAYNTAGNTLGLGNMSTMAGAAGMTPGMTPGMAPGMGMEGGMEPGMMMSEMSPGMEMGAPTTGMMNNPLVGRYVDENFQPVPVEGDKAIQPYAEFKMMPVRLSLVMDQRKIPELMVKCANSKMPVEIRRLRLSPDSAPKVTYGAGTGSAMSGAPSMGSTPTFGGEFMGEGAGRYGGASGEMGEWMGGGGEMPGAGRESGSYRGPYDMPVEILGIIYIYNPPDKDKLATGTAATGVEPLPVAAATPETPASQPATPPVTGPATPPAAPGPGPAAPPAGAAAPPPATPVPPAGAGPTPAVPTPTPPAATPAPANP